LSGDNDFTYHAKMDAVNSSVNPNRTVRCCAILPNKEDVFMPGMNVRVRLTIGEPHKALLVPKTAAVTALPDPNQLLVYVGNEQNIVEGRKVTVGQGFGDLQVIMKGLKSEDWVIKPGSPSLEPGTTVKPERPEQRGK
jgi:multidrug efflux pump subunit AcrA (membrane-fusion protein)